MFSQILTIQMRHFYNFSTVCGFVIVIITLKSWLRAQRSHFQSARKIHKMFVAYGYIYAFLIKIDHIRRSFLRILHSNSIESFVFKNLACKFAFVRVELEHLREQVLDVCTRLMKLCL